MRYSRDRPNSGRSLKPIMQPGSAAANDFSGGQGLRANGALAAAAAMAPRIMPKSVRLEVSLRIESPSARLGPAHCQNSAWEKSAPSSDAILAPHTVNPNVTLHG